ncbi:MAG: aminotransferase class I/II-fold pyridoxal phosphate-dependent enzyme [Patescibacteria group bacterium]
MSQFPILEKTSIWPALSEFGKEIVSPQGIFYWSGRAKKESEVNATLGTAVEDDGKNCYIPMMEGFLSDDFFKKVGGAVFEYAPMPGLLTLREKWRARMLKNSPELERYASTPVVTNGITHGIYIMGMMLMNEGEEMLTPEKYWSNYNLILPTMQRMKITPIPFFNADGRLDVDGIAQEVESCAQRQKKVVLLLNFPHNQTGFTPNEKEAAVLISSLQEIAGKNPDVPFVIVLDDAYEGYVYDGDGIRKSIFDRVFPKGMKNFSMVKMDGVSKSMLVYGLRVGFITVFANKTDGTEMSEEEHKGFCEEVANKLAGVVRGTISNCSRVGQAMTEAVLDAPEEWEKEVTSKIDLLGRRYRALKSEIEKCYEEYGRGKIWADPFNSGFFCYMNIVPEIDAKDIAEKLLREYKIGVVPNTVKDKDGKILWNGIRVAFCGVPESQMGRLAKGIFEAVYR